MLWFLSLPDEVKSAPEALDVARLFDAHVAFLLRVAERMTGSATHAEDVVQEAFLIAHRKRHELRAGEDIRGWLYRVVQNLILHHRRGIARRHRLSEAVGNEPGPGPSVDPTLSVERRETGERIRRVVAKLSPAAREVFVLYELEELQGAEIAALLGIPENTVWTRLHHARKAFRTEWLSARDVSGPTPRSRPPLEVSP